jgi:hypothetical protein
MFSSKTVFIVGAGASHEAGLPTGAQLKAVIAEKLNITYKIGINLTSPDTGDAAIAWALTQYVRNTTGDINPYLFESWKIQDAMPQALSIDNYMDAHSSNAALVLCGKLGIARAIIDAERKSRLFVDDRPGTSPIFDHSKVRDTWYLKFFQLLAESVKKEDLGDLFANISFVSFNYDRCIEHYLYHALRNYYNVGEADAQRVMTGLTISHPYGMVGSLPWQGQASVVFGGRMNMPLLDIAKELRTFTERMEDAETLAAIRRQIQEAETIVFLGFAFHPLNIELLTPGGKSKAKRVFGTAKGISDADVEVITQGLTEVLRAGTKGGKDAFKIALRNGLTCDQLFGEYWRSLSQG